MGSQRTKIVLLVTLLVAWGAVVGLRYLAAPPAAAPASPPAARAEAARPSRGQGGGPSRLKTELLSAPRPPLPAEVHTIFGNVLPPPPPLAAASAPVSKAPPPPAAPPPDPFLEAAKSLRFLGYIEHEATRRAIILQGPEMHLLAPGDAFAGRFRVKNVTDEYVVVASTDGAKETRLELTQASAPSGPKPATGPGVPPRPGGPAFPRM